MNPNIKVFEPKYNECKQKNMKIIEYEGNLYHMFKYIELYGKNPSGMNKFVIEYYNILNSCNLYFDHLLYINICISCTCLS